MNIATFDFEAHLARQASFSALTFGPGARTEGICDHIRKDLVEVAAAPGDLKEWIDVVILALDGAWRCGATPAQIIEALVAKQIKNEGRAWPDWRTADPAKAIEHDRAGESEQAAANGTPQPIVGRLMDQISALPVLWGLNEPGALLRNSDVLRVLVAAGREQAAPAAQGDAEPDMLWDAADTEGTFANGAEEFAENYANNGMSRGDISEVDIQCAVRMRDRKMRIEVTADEENWLKWEWIDAAIDAKEAS